MRTSYSNDAAWEAFYVKLKDAEREIIESVNSSPTQEGESLPAASNPQDVEMEDGNESDGGSSTGLLSSVIRVLDFSNPEERRVVENISNIAALRLFNDVDLRPAPARPTGTKKVQPPSPLIDQADWQEIYAGPTIWIYDDKSVRDECVRLVSPSGDFYGTATCVLAFRCLVWIQTHSQVVVGTAGELACHIFANCSST